VVNYTLFTDALTHSILCPIDGDPFPMSDDGKWLADDSIDFRDSWPEVEKLYEQGKAKAIGVSNFHIKKYI
jgi:diketogulonate reductase-like aldo/keto reductase